MRAVVQRVARAQVRVGAEAVGTIGPGLLVLAGAAAGDSPEDVSWLCRKIVNLRIFPDADGRMNLAVREAGGEVLLVSQFTLCADLSRGSRPSFTGAMEPAKAQELLVELEAALRRELRVATGRFGADMAVELVNEGPATFWLDSRERP